MPAEAKPLFRPHVLRPHVEGYDLPPHVSAFREKLEHWAELIRSERINTFNEKKILPDFLTDFLLALPGYSTPHSLLTHHYIRP